MDLSDDSQSSLHSVGEGVTALIESMSTEMSHGIEKVLSDLNLMSKDIDVHRNWVQTMIATGTYHFAPPRKTSSQDILQSNIGQTQFFHHCRPFRRT